MPGVEGAIVKEPYGYHSAQTVTPARGQAMIRDGVTRAMGKLGSLQPYRADDADRARSRLQADDRRRARRLRAGAVARPTRTASRARFRDMTEITKLLQVLTSFSHPEQLTSLNSRVSTRLTTNDQRPMTKYGCSPWLDEFPRSRVPAYPRYRGASTADVVVIGGGLTGCATAYAFAAAGVKMMLLEAEQVGRGSSAFSTGWIADDPGVAFADLEKALGTAQTPAARGRAGGGPRSISRRSLRRLDVKCHHRSARVRDGRGDAGAGWRG